MWGCAEQMHRQRLASGATRMRQGPSSYLPLCGSLHHDLFRRAANH